MWGRNDARKMLSYITGARVSLAGAPSVRSALGSVLCGGLFPIRGGCPQRLIATASSLTQVWGIFGTPVWSSSSHTPHTGVVFISAGARPCGPPVSRTDLVSAVGSPLLVDWCSPTPGHKCPCPNAGGGGVLAPILGVQACSPRRLLVVIVLRTEYPGLEFWFDCSSRDPVTFFQSL